MKATDESAIGDVEMHHEETRSRRARVEHKAPWARSEILLLHAGDNTHGGPVTYQFESYHFYSGTYQSNVGVMS
ncbi:MAG: hypothetical protein GY708_28510 [Actinomycetia bacterium]|nr:hypothetical protein [Actinomycetes bacterium]